MGTGLWLGILAAGFPVYLVWKRLLTARRTTATNE